MSINDSVKKNNSDIEGFILSHSFSYMNMPKSAMQWSAPSRVWRKRIDVMRAASASSHSHLIGKNYKLKNAEINLYYLFVTKIIETVD